MMSRRDCPLQIRIVRGILQISVGVDMLCSAAERSDEFQPYNETACDFDQWKISDQNKFAEEVIHALRDEAENGSTPLTRLLDAMCLEALENGADAELIPAKRNSASGEACQERERS